MPARRAAALGATVGAAALALALGPTVFGTSARTDGPDPVTKAPLTHTATPTPPGPDVAQPVPDDAPAASPAAAAAAACRVQPLRTLGGRFGSATAAAARYVVGVSHDANGAQHPVLWRNGVPTRLDTGFTGAVPSAVSSTGAVVGSASDRRVDAPVGWYWSEGRTWKLQGTDDRAAVPEAISATGVIVGALAEIETVSHTEHRGRKGGDADVLVNEQAHDEETEKAALWTSYRAAPRVLSPLPGDDGAHAYAVTANGLAGGLSMGAGFTPVVWDSAGRAHALASLSGGWAVVRGFDRAGAPVGEASAADGSMHVVRWTSDGRVVDLGRGSVRKYLAHVGTPRVAAGSEPDAVGAPRPVTWRCS